jgi:hypothetical protein
MRYFARFPGLQTGTMIDSIMVGDHGAAGRRRSGRSTDRR